MNGISQFTEPWPGYRRQHIEDSPAASALSLTDLIHRKYKSNRLKYSNV